MKARKRRPIALLLAASLASACSGEPLQPESQVSAPPVPPDLSFLEGREGHEPQLLLDDRGGLLVVWREKGEEGSDLYVARRGDDGRLGQPVRVNDEAGTVASYPHDEMRAAVAAGENGRVGLAWSDSRGQVRAAVSTDGAASFGPSIRLEQTDEAAYRGFPAVAFDHSGALQAVWIDSRYAGGFAEEPADLYHATVVDGVVTESNLTAEQEDTVCGCCRTYLEVTAEGATRAVFRNGANGYRDIFTVSGDASGMSAPVLIGQPLWELEGCPMSGPIAVSDTVLWPDGSAGQKLVMAASFGPEPARTLFASEESDEWQARLSPREVVSSESAAPLVLLPGQSSSRMVTASGDGWRLVADDLPPWATAGLYENGSLLLVGAVSGEVRSEVRAMTAR